MYPIVTMAGSVLHMAFLDVRLHGWFVFWTDQFDG